MKKLLLITSILISASQFSLAENSIGIGYGVTSSFYHSDSNNYLLPIVNLNYNRFFLKGSTVYGLQFGYKVLEEDNYLLSLYGMPFGGYKIKGSDMKDGYKTMDTRKTQFMGGMEFTYHPQIFDLVTSVSTEFGENGGIFNLRVSKPYHITPNFTIIPTITATYYNSDFIDYYFGVNQNELNNEKLTQIYDGKSAYRYGVGILGNYKFNENLSLTGFTGVTKFSSEVKNSPLVDKDTVFLFGTGIVYTF